MSRLESKTIGVAVFALAWGCLGVFIAVVANHQNDTAKTAACRCKPTPTPTPAACCKADKCRKELDLVDARFGGVWDELVEVQEQLARVKPCDCGPVKECCCDPSKPEQKCCDPQKAPSLPDCKCGTYRGRKCECAVFGMTSVGDTWEPKCTCAPGAIGVLAPSWVIPGNGTFEPAPKPAAAPACGRRGRR